VVRCSLNIAIFRRDDAMNGIVGVGCVVGRNATGALTREERVLAVRAQELSNRPTDNDPEH
jgi:hypothetical protein